MKGDVDVILPLYRPKPGWNVNVRESMEELCGYFAGRGATVRFYVVNDGSGMEYFPEELLAELRAVTPEFYLLGYERNHGKGYSLRYGVSRARGDYQVYTDGDFPFGWKSVARAYEMLQSGADVVMGVRGSDYGAALPPLRKVLSKGGRKLNSMVLGLPEHLIDTQAGLKGFNHAGRAAFLDTTVKTFLFDTEFIVLAHRRGLAVATVGLSLREGLHFSRMGVKVMLRELRHLGGIFVRCRLLGARREIKGRTADEKA